MTEPGTDQDGVAPTFRDLLERAGLGLDAVHLDTGQLATPITWSHTTELHDPSRYLRGGQAEVEA